MPKNTIKRWKFKENNIKQNKLKTHAHTANTQLFVCELYGWISCGSVKQSS
jgi:hypothetical protein